MASYVYIVTNKSNSVLYIGMSNDISLRIESHKKKLVEKSFTAKYNCTKLVHIEEFENFEEAKYREFQLKNWNRKWKNELIEKNNPGYLDLSEDL